MKGEHDQAMQDDSTVTTRSGPGGPLSIPSFTDDDDAGLPPTPAQPWYRQTRWIAGIAVLLVIVLIVGLIVARRSGKTTPITYQYATAQTGNLVLSVSATGPLQSGIYNISFTGSGKIAEIDVQVGQTVTVGQVLAKLDPTSLQDALNQANAAVASANASVASAQNGVTTAKMGVSAQQASAATTQTQVNAASSALSNAQNNLNNVKAEASANLSTAYDQEQNALYACNNPPKGTSSAPNCTQLAQDQYSAAQATANAQIASAQAQVDSAQASLNTAQSQSNAAQTNVDNANAQVSTAEASVNTAEASLASAETARETAIHNLANDTLTAPHAGVIAAVNGVVGSTPGITAAGTSSGTFIQIADLSSVQIQAAINEADIANVADGNTVSFTVSAYKSRTFSGTVSAISPVGVTTANVVSYPVTINVDLAAAQGANLLPGMTASVTIFTVRRTNVLLIPITAVTFAANSGPTGAYKLLTRAQLRTAIVAATQMLRALETKTPDIQKDNPTAAFVVEGKAGAWTAVPVVIGLTDGTYDEVLGGLSAGASFAVGRTGGTGGATTTTTLLPGRFGGGGGGGGGRSGGGAGGAGGGNGG